MFMTAHRIKIEGRPVLKLIINEFETTDIQFLNSLGIDQVEDDKPNVRYILIHSQEDFLNTRASILDRYNVVEEKGPRVFLQAK